MSRRLSWHRSIRRAVYELIGVIALLALIIILFITFTNAESGRIRYLANDFHLENISVLSRVLEQLWHVEDYLALDQTGLSPSTLKDLEIEDRNIKVVSLHVIKTGSSDALDRLLANPDYRFDNLTSVFQRRLSVYESRTRDHFFNGETTSDDTLKGVSALMITVRQLIALHTQVRDSLLVELSQQQKVAIRIFGILLILLLMTGLLVTRRGLAAIQTVIDERGKIESELLNHRENLENLVKMRTAELADARQHAESADQAKSEFLANMSHEIRTPMNAIVGLTHLMQESKLTDEQSQRLAKIDSSGKHLLSIINDILDLSKIEAGKLSLEKTDFLPDTLLKEVFALVKDQAVDKGLEFEINNIDLDSWLKGDQTRLRQALLNYVSNAIKFTSTGKITISARKLGQKGEGILARFEVTDTGIGIMPEKMDGLFAAFEQADVSTTREYGGTGLGLTITRRLAEMMGGEVGVESELNSGSTFWFTAELDCGAPVPLGRGTSRITDAGRKLREACAGSRVLLVEDNPINLEVARELLSRVGLEVDTAEEGHAAVKLAGANNYDLLLMDVQMPVMDGLEATRTIRARNISGNGQDRVAIIAMTANVFEDDRRACLEAGMDDMVGKPVDPEHLYSTLLRWMPVVTSGP